MSIKVKLCSYLLAVFCLAGFSGLASAHTTSIGFLNSGPGSVTFWAGSYHACTGGNEGGLDLIGANSNPFPSTLATFSGGISCSKPAGLVDGVNNFYANSNAAGPLVSSISVIGAQWAPVMWQSLTFTGLTAGDYRFDLNNINTTARFAAWNASLGAIFTLSGVVVGNCGTADQPPCATPVPAVLPLMGIGLFGFAAALRRRQQKAA